MAVTFALTTSPGGPGPRQGAPPDNLFEITISFVPDNSYPNTGVAATSGYSCKPADMPFSCLHIADVFVVGVVPSANGGEAAFDYANSRLKLYTATAQVANGVDVSGMTIMLRVRFR